MSRMFPYDTYVMSYTSYAWSWLVSGHQ